MNDNIDRELRDWAADWQAGDETPDAPQAIRDYVVNRSTLIRRWLWAELAVAGIALPVLGYVWWTTQDTIERLAMLLMGVITVGAVALGRWNWRGVREGAAGTTIEFVELSLARIGRVRQAIWMGWGILIAEVAVFALWISARFADGAVSRGSERFAWSWLSVMAIAAVGHIVWLSRWVDRDAARFESLRREFELPDGPVTSPDQRPPTSGPRRASGLRARLRSRNRAVPR